MSRLPLCISVNFVHASAMHRVRRKKTARRRNDFAAWSLLTPRRTRAWMQRRYCARAPQEDANVALLIALEYQWPIALYRRFNLASRGIAIRTLVAAALDFGRASKRGLADGRRSKELWLDRRVEETIIV